MKQEFFDIVNENNELLGFTKERSLVHRDGDWHNSVHIYVMNNKNEVLAHLRSRFKDLCPNTWETKFGGHVVAGDTNEHTAVRELEEEVGIKTDIKNLIKGPTIKYDRGSNKEFNPSYYYLFQKGDIITPDKEEVAEVKWMLIKDIFKSMKEDPEAWGHHARTTMKEVYEYWKKLKK